MTKIVEVEASAGERVKLAEAAEVKAQKAEQAADAATKKAEIAAQRAEDAKAAPLRDYGLGILSCLFSSGIGSLPNFVLVI